MLSNNDIKRELIKSKNLAIHPLKVENIKGSSINLTASKYAWNLKDNNSAYFKRDNVIVIPPNETVSIYTEEGIWVSRRIGGTYHPRVSLVAKGLSNISTTLDPQWYGLSLVTVTNQSSDKVEIPVGQAFVSVMLYYLKTPATKGVSENLASRPDISAKFQKTHEEDVYLSNQWHRSHEALANSMLSSDSYKELYKNKTKYRRKISNFFGHNFVSGLAGGLVATVIGGIILYLIGIK